MRDSLLTVLVAGVLLATSAGAAEKSGKLYRWVGADGKVHYGDSVPPDAVDQQREMLNSQGMTVDRVDRALTDEERAEQQRLAAEQAARAKSEEEQAKLDAVLLGSYQSEADLERSYHERFALVEQTLESARVGIVSQQKSLADQLAHAADLERAGKPIPANISQNIATARKQVLDQRDFLHKQQQEQAELQREHDQTLARFRELKNPPADG